MDFLQSCITSVYFIDGFDTIHCCRYTADYDKTLKPTLRARELDIDNLQRKIASLRKEGYLVVFSVDDDSLWLFRSSEEHILRSTATRSSAVVFDDSIVLENGTVLYGDSFTLSAAALLEATLATPRLPHSSPLAVESPDELASKDGYKRFIEACVQTLRARFADSANVLPLNFRTFFSEYLPPGSIDTLFSGSSTCAVDIDIQLSAAGSLSLSTKRSTMPQWRPRKVQDLTGKESGHISPTSLVRIAPSGRIMRVVQPMDFQHSLSSFIDHTATILAGESKYWQYPAENCHNPWQEAVMRRLSYLGINMPTSASNSPWLRVSGLPQQSLYAMSESQVPDRGSFLWPAFLCIHVEAPSEWQAYHGSMPKLGTALRWFQHDLSPGFQDPLECALEFAQNRDKRDAETRSRQVTSALDSKVNSPAYQRNLIALESYGVSGIYPTPPDGLPSGVTPASVSADVYVIPRPAGGHLRQVGAADKMNLTTPADYPYDDAAENLDAVCEMDDVEVGLGEDDEEDDLFDSKGITEADFSFFDEPDCDLDRQMDDIEVSPQAEQGFGDPGQASGRTPPTKSVAEAVHGDGDVTDMVMNEATDNNVPHSSAINEERISALNKFTPPQFRINHCPQSPPLDPITIKDRLSSKSPMAPPPKPTNGIMSNETVHDPWQPLNFRTAIGHSDEKYRSSGRFIYDTNENSSSANSDTITSKLLPRLETLISPSDPSLYAAAATSRRQRSRKYGNGSGLRAIAASQFSDSYNPMDSSDSDSDTAARYITKPHPARGLDQPATVTSRRNSTASVNVSIDAAYSWTGDSKQGRERRERWMTSLLDLLLLEDSADWSLTEFPAPRLSAPSRRPSPLTTEDFIAIAQLVSQQVLNNVGNLQEDVKEADVVGCAQHQFWAPSEAIDNAITAGFCTVGRPVRWEFLPKTTAGDPMESATLSSAAFEVNSTLQHKDTTNMAIDAPSQFSEDIFTIPSPSIQIQKTDTQKLESNWEILASAFRFWETLGLGPANGAKVVRAYCLYPYSDGIEAYISQFFDAIESTWHNCKLGSHSLGLNVDDDLPGLIPVHLSGEVSVSGALRAFEAALQELASTLATTMPRVNGSVVVYICNPFETDDALYDLCTYFQVLMQTLKAHASLSSRQRPQPILQIIPIRMVASFTKPVCLSIDVAAFFARGVYDRCPVTQYPYNVDLRIPSSASIVLAETGPKAVHFRLTAEPPSDLLHEQSCMHVAYCQSLDDNWITAAWTDNIGKYQHMTSYSMQGATSLENVALEIWETTLVYIGDRKTRWLICLAKVGPLELLERDIWTGIIQTCAKPGTEISVVLTSVITNPIIEVIPTPPITAFTKSTMQTGTSITPISTPQPQVFSPAAATPGGPTTSLTAAAPEASDADRAARLVDITDESWGMVLSHSLSVARSITTYNPALVSGYLIKRTGAGDSDPPVLLEVNIMARLSPSAAGLVGGAHAENVKEKKQQEQKALRELLVAYRGLALLARLRGMEAVTGCRPWHVIVVQRAAQALMQCMPVPERFIA